MGRQKRSENTYQKIQTVFKRDEKNVIMPYDELTQPEFDFLRGMPWRCEEKIDGCLEARTAIVMTDGSTRKIKDVRPGDYVMGYDTDGGTGTKEVRVQGVQCLHADGTWLRIKTSRYGMNKGNAFGIIRCTFDHRIWTKNRGYVEAWQLKRDDVLLSIRINPRLTPVQEQVLTGKMLGDGTLSIRENDGFNSAHIEWSQKDLEYSKWCADSIQELATEKVHSTKSGYGTQMYRYATKNSVMIYEKFAEWNKDGHKEVPSDIALSPISIAFWYMDDGTLLHNDGQEDRVRFATNAFNMESCLTLCRELRKFGIESTVCDYKGNTICMNAENAEKMFLLVFPYICKSMKYKLPERYRDSPSYMPKISPSGYQRLVVEQRVLDIEKENKTYERWDIQTETHNFFTTGGLVHNTNIRLEVERVIVIENNGALIPVYREDGDWMLEGDNYEVKAVQFSVHYKGKTDNANIHPNLLKHLQETYPDERVLASLGLKREIPVEEWAEHKWQSVDDIPQLYTIYGEGYGAKIQKAGGNYLSKGNGFIVFDVKVDDMYLLCENRDAIAAKLGAPVVPFIGMMTLSDAIDYVRHGFKSRIAENKDFMAEGLVIRNELGLRTRRGERIITKLKTCDFQKYRAVYGTDEWIPQTVNSHIAE